MTITHDLFEEFGCNVKKKVTRYDFFEAFIKTLNKIDLMENSSLAFGNFIETWENWDLVEQIFKNHYDKWLKLPPQSEKWNFVTTRVYKPFRPITNYFSNMLAGWINIGFFSYPGDSGKIGIIKKTQDYIYSISVNETKFIIKNEITDVKDCDYMVTLYKERQEQKEEIMKIGFYVDGKIKIISNNSMFEIFQHSGDVVFFDKDYVKSLKSLDELVPKKVLASINFCCVIRKREQRSILKLSVYDKSIDTMVIYAFACCMITFSANCGSSIYDYLMSKKTKKQ
ncbi:MAG: hypothetical protein HUJ42_03635 [Malacoplasma sp.]|nr:hypothetical protein [Malacoplasma sp.]